MHENVTLQIVNVYINAVPKKSDQGLQASKCYNIQQQHEQNDKKVNQKRGLYRTKVIRR